MDAREFEDANAACGLLPGPASTQLAIFCAYRVGGPVGAIVGGLGFVVPAVVLVLAALGALPRLCPAPVGARRGSGRRRRRGRGRRAGGALAARAELRARARRASAPDALGASTSRPPPRPPSLIVPYLVLVLLGCGLIELVVQHPPRRALGGHGLPLALVAARTAAVGGLGALCWTAFKVGALSYGGGFVIVPLMQGDAVDTYHWMTNAQFLNAVALGQITPGPVVATIAAVGYSAHGIAGGLLAAAVAFTPSFSFILLGGDRFRRLRENANARAFLDGAAPAAIGAILGAAVTLAAALTETWQVAVLAAAAVALLVLRRGVVETLLCAGRDRRRRGARRWPRPLITSRLADIRTTYKGSDPAWRGQTLYRCAGFARSSSSPPGAVAS